MDESQKIKIIIIRRAPGPYGASPIRSLNAVLMLKSKSNTVLKLILNILTAFIRLGRAGPVGAGCPPYS